MTKWNIDVGKKVTGGKVNQVRKKKKYMRGSIPLLTVLGDPKNKVVKALGGQKKVKLISVDYVNLTDQKTKKANKVKIIGIVEHRDNPHYTRRGIITKGSIVRTESGLAKITSRPSQHGIVNGILIEEKT
jgi:small subunit ribosomal protein S8e